MCAEHMYGWVYTYLCVNHQCCRVCGGGGGGGECVLHMEGAMMFDCGLQKMVVT